MGAVSFSLDMKLIKAIINIIPFEIFFETGTFKGDTVAQVKNYFNKIISIELSKEYYEAAKNQFTNDAHVTILQDDSPVAIKRLMPTFFNQSILFWLDAHWCVAENTAGETSQCPLLEELKAIEKLNSKSMIIIDDARLFLTAPLAPHEVSNWPSFSEIINTLLKLSPSHKIAVVNDCILFFPPELEDSIKTFSQHYGVDWLQIYHQALNHPALYIENIAKEKEIHSLASICADRLNLINDKDDQIKSLTNKIKILENYLSKTTIIGKFLFLRKLLFNSNNVFVSNGDKQ